MAHSATRNTSGISYARSYRTLRDGSFEGRFPRHLVPGYDRCCPSGDALADISQQHLASSRVNVLKQKFSNLKLEILQPREDEHRVSDIYPILNGLCNFFSGNLTRKTLLYVVMPVIFFSYFGTLSFAVSRFPEAYDWRDTVISHLISPRNNPEFHALPSFGMAITGLLMIPFAGYINRRLRVACRLGANIGSFLFGSGAIWLILAGLIVSQKHHEVSILPRLHEICARTAAVGVGTGLLAFCFCATKEYFTPSIEKNRFERRLLISWILLILVPILGVVFSECLLLTLRAHLLWSYRTDLVLKGTLFWHLAFWEWIGSAAVFLFLLSSALFLPEQTRRDLGGGVGKLPNYLPDTS
jgi:hypothetical protein